MRKKEKTAFVCWHLSSVLKKLKVTGVQTRSFISKIPEISRCFGLKVPQMSFFFCGCVLRGDPSRSECVVSSVFVVCFILIMFVTGGDDDWDSL